MGVISPPELLTEDHDTTQFDCGSDMMTEWLKKHALKNQGNGASRTFVICQDGVVIGYYALATGSVEHAQAPRNLRRNMPDPIPVIILGRLAIDAGHQGERLGAALLKDAMRRTLTVAQQAGVKAMLTHAISEDATCFYVKFGFRESPIDPMTLMLPVKDIIAHL